jgi:hypothetical protein
MDGNKIDVTNYINRCENGKEHKHVRYLSIMHTHNLAKSNKNTETGDRVD